MSDTTSKPVREIKYKLTAEQVIAALMGDTTLVPGIRWLTKVEMGKEFSYYTDSEAIVFEYAEIESIDATKIETDKIIFLNECICNGWYFANCKLKLILIRSSTTGFISISESSTTGHISIRGSSITDHISIFESSNTGRISISESSTTDYISISESSTVGNISISESSTAGRIEISRSSTTGDITIIQSSTKGINISGNSTTRDIINLSSSTGEINISDSSNAGDIDISGSSIIGYISIRGNSVTGYIIISQGSTTGNIRIDNNRKAGNLTIISQSVTGEIHLDKAVLGDISLRNSFSSSINIEHCENIPELEITNSRTGELYIRDSEINSVYLNRFQNSITLSKWNIASLRIEHSHLPAFRTTGLAAGEVFISDTHINHLNLGTTNISASCSLTLARCHIYAVQFEYTNVLGPLFLRKLNALKELFAFSPDNAHLYKIDEQVAQENPQEQRSEEYLSRRKKLFDGLKDEHDRHLEAMHDLKFFTSTFRLVHSSLGKAELSECNFSDFTFQYYNTKLVDCFITGTELPDEKDVIVHDGRDQLKNPSWQWHRQRMFFFNQIKRAYENIGDSVAAGQQHALAMNEQKQVLEHTRRSTRKKRWKLRFDKFTFTMNAITNNHGENWWRSFWLTVVSGGVVFIFYSLHLWLRQCWYYGLHEDYGHSLWYHWQSLPEWFLFTHRFDFMSSDVGGWGKLWDVLGRILIGYGIYQFVAAFRRHGKKAV